jgi:hypothetical protein
MKRYLSLILKNKGFSTEEEERALQKVEIVCR